MTIVTTLRSSIPKRSILVTGGAGFIGSHLVEALLADGYWKVVVIDNFDEFYSPEIKRANLADIRDIPALTAIFADNNFSVVVHLAARAGVLPSLQVPDLYFDVNVTGTMNLLQCCKDFGVKQFVFGSSSSVYGLGAKAPFSESQKTTQPISPYAASKSAGELLCHPGLISTRYAVLIHQGKPIPLFGNGSSIRDYTYVDDIIDGIFGAIDYEGSMFEAINLGESQTITLIDLISAIEVTLGRKALIDWRGEQPGDMPLTYADISKAGSIIGYKPKTQVQQGIVKFVAWYLNHNEV
ncbi:hypothetical protein ACHAP4_009379 [Fusarium culmorum]